MKNRFSAFLVFSAMLMAVFAFTLQADEVQDLASDAIADAWDDYGAIVVPLDYPNSDDCDGLSSTMFTLMSRYMYLTLSTEDDAAYQEMMGDISDLLDSLYELSSDIQGSSYDSWMYAYTADTEYYYDEYEASWYSAGDSQAAGVFAYENAANATAMYTVITGLQISVDALLSTYE